ncbi:MAG TPA: hypothetical protein VM939_02220 [Gemmatimonadaceae bacterium]|nr:hypothetical protein [Gemmatimonadaceae bacterium]
MTESVIVAPVNRGTNGRLKRMYDYPVVNAAYDPARAARALPPVAEPGGNMGKKKERGGHQQGALNHEPSQQGKLTRQRQQEIANSGSGESTKAKGPQFDPEEIRAHDDVGKDRLFEDREQHDEAEKNSEKTRLARDIDRHEHGSNDELSERERQAMAKRKS